MDITLTSTTETQEDVNRVVGIEPEVVEETAEEPSETPETPEGEQEEVETAPAPDTGNEEKEHKGKGRFTKRIDTLVRERYEARQEADKLRQEIEQLKTGAKPVEVAPQIPDGKPQRSSFTSDEEWVDALAAYKAQQAIAKWQADEAQKKRQERDSTIVASYQQRVDEFSQEHPDFNEVADISLAAEIGPAVEAAIKGRPNGPEIAYYLGQNPDVQDELNGMNPVEAVAEIGAISASLLPQKTSPKPAAKVPPPLTPVGGSTRVAQNMSDLDPDAWIAERKRQKLAARSR